ncbi:Putative GroES-like superfamily, alcohol dehydrogenase, NAD(P)-binding domain superfamily [Septoria linicola]|uniref:GroES-like superfamily, alcohol dehydrogenase, NAD(P)-binding domain superfamily n=1 Tax=Septoria linicola TaxID=215465 RepID=A0A9Q9EMM7_9PEZI|nr:putative GroES-like superfamily, alcohol dehydrogenase, NAD(P)-binding domain superfamily [Septoria linicola]USW56956.1 Putative GroES-like superfamily, alcohol dehydrogenase, NAD(P)-binding domain superfamily [Septoria linicola]
MSKQQQSAVLVTEVGKPVTLGKRDIPTPEHDEVLVKVIATMLLPHDAYGRDWGLEFGDRLPAVLGSNIAGTIEQTGASVTGFGAGDVVFGLANIYKPSSDQAGTQEYATLTASAIAKVPTGFTTGQVVTLPVNLFTSFQALFTQKQGFNWPAPWQLRKDFDPATQTIITIGAGSVIGKYAIQPARLANIGQIIAIAGPTNEAELESLGATHIIDRHDSIETITSKYDQQPELLAKGRPLCKADSIEGESANLRELESGFWKNLPMWLEEGKIVPSAFCVVDGLDKADEINAALDGYMTGKGGPQLIVRP